MTDPSKIIGNDEISEHIKALKASIDPRDAVLVVYDHPVDDATVQSDLLHALHKSGSTSAHSSSVTIEPVNGGDRKVFAVKSPGIARLAGTDKEAPATIKVPGGTPPPPPPSSLSRKTDIIDKEAPATIKVPGGTPPPPPPSSLTRKTDIIDKEAPATIKVPGGTPPPPPPSSLTRKTDIIDKEAPATIKVPGGTPPPPPPSGTAPLLRKYEILQIP